LPALHITGILAAVVTWLIQGRLQEGGRLVHFVRLTTTPLTDEEFTRYLEYMAKTAVVKLLLHRF